MKVLIYKRTHKGDPDLDGVFGTQDCMGRIRNWNYDAVIGIGGIAPWKKDVDIKCKINWIGLGPKKIASTERGNMIAFAHFELYEGQGKNHYQMEHLHHKFRQPVMQHLAVGKVLSYSF